jgi:hypothetical protein
MRFVMRWLVTINAALLCSFAVGACGGSDETQSQGKADESREDIVDDDGDGGSGKGEGSSDDDDGTPTQDQADESDEDGNGTNGGPGIPGGGSDDEAPGAPIKIPSIVDDFGRPLNQVLAEIESGIRDQCDGELCVELRVEMSEPTLDKCQFVGTEPPQGSFVERDTTVVVVAGTLPCPGEEQSTGDEQPNTDDSSTGDQQPNTDDSSTGDQQPNTDDSSTGDQQPNTDDGSTDDSTEDEQP